MWDGRCSQATGGSGPGPLPDGPPNGDSAPTYSPGSVAPDPAELFNTHPNAPNQYAPSAVLASMAFGGTAAGIPAGTYFGAITFAVLPFSDAAVTVPDKGTWMDNGSPGGIAASANIVLQSSTLTPGYFGDETTQQIALTLIHELGHVYNEVYGLGGSAIKYDSLPSGLPDPIAEKQNADTLAKCHLQ